MPEYIWNGVGLTTPDTWEPSALERDGFLLEREGFPACELKWRTVHGTFSFEKHIKKLARSSKDADIRPVSPKDTPGAWRTALDRLDASGMKSQSFIWSAGTHRGIGAALHNSATGLATLIQFFIVDEIDESIAAETLATFRDYLSGKTIPWAMFGLRARVPNAFRLNTFSFKPGRYTVKFWRPKSSRQAGKLPAGKGPGTALTFERFAPATVLLKDTAMTDWVTNHVEDAPKDALPLTKDGQTVSWAGTVKSSALRKLLRREVHSAGQVWTTDAGNAILTVATTGVVPLEHSEFTTICDSYVLV